MTINVSRNPRGIAISWKLVEIRVLEGLSSIIGNRLFGGVIYGSSRKEDRKKGIAFLSSMCVVFLI